MDDWLSLRLRLAAAAVLLATPCRPLIAQSQALVFIEGFRVHDSLSLIAAESLRSELPRHLAQRGPAVMSTRDIDEPSPPGSPMILAWRGHGMMSSRSPACIDAESSWTSRPQRSRSEFVCERRSSTDPILFGAMSRRLSRSRSARGLCCWLDEWPATRCSATLEQSRADGEDGVMTSPDRSRREFLAMSALTLLGATGLARRTFDNSNPDDQLLYVGTYTDDKRTDGVYFVLMNARTGELQLIGSANVGPNPSFLAIHPNGRVLYAVNEVAEHNGKRGGAVGAYAIAATTGALTRINEQSTAGAGPCYVSVDREGRAVLVANYDAGSVALLPIHGDGSLGEAQIDQHQGSGPDKERQEGPHAHSIVADPSNRFALGADLGTDRIVVYRLDGQSGGLRHLLANDAQLEPGSGPRHIAFHPTLPLVFVASELKSSVTTLRFDRERGTLAVIASQSTLPTDWKGKSYVADIHVDSLGRTVYVSNRGHNSVAVFSVQPKTGALTLTQVVPTGGAWPRNFSLDPTERWLLVANQNSGSVVVFARDRESGRLSETPRRLAVPSPACLRFRDGSAI